MFVEYIVPIIKALNKMTYIVFYLFCRLDCVDEKITEFLEEFRETLEQMTDAQFKKLVGDLTEVTSQNCT